MEKYGVSPQELIMSLLPLVTQTKVRKSVQLALEIHRPHNERFAFNILTNEDTGMVMLQVYMGQQYTGKGRTVEDAAENLYVLVKQRATEAVEQRMVTARNAIETRDRATADAEKLAKLLEQQNPGDKPE